MQDVRHIGQLQFYSRSTIWSIIRQPRAVHDRRPVQYVAQLPATKDGNMYFVPQKASNQLKLTLKVASAVKKQV